MEKLREAQPEWLRDLFDQVRESLAAMEGSEPHRRLALQAEHEQLEAQIQGWSRSLSNPSLATEVRILIETKLGEAIARQSEIAAFDRERASRAERAELVLDIQQVLESLERLSDVLATNNPTRGNLELSLHIDRITCHPSGQVDVRTCKLGAMGGAVEMLADPGSDKAASHSMKGVPSNGRRSARRRTKLRTSDGAGDTEHLDLLADFAADPHRFDGLGEEWFSTDTFQAPVTRSWTSTHASEVKARHDSIAKETGKKPTLNMLAAEFGKSRPTIKEALRVAEQGPEHAPSRRGYCREKNLQAQARADELVAMFEGNLQIQAISEKTGFHRNTVARIIDERRAELGMEPRQDGRKTRWGRKRLPRAS